MASREVKKAHDRQRLIVHLDRSAASRLASARARWTSSTHRPKTRSARSFASGSRRTSPPTYVSTTRQTNGSLPIYRRSRDDARGGRRCTPTDDTVVQVTCRYVDGEEEGSST